MFLSSATLRAFKCKVSDHLVSLEIIIVINDFVLYLYENYFAYFGSYEILFQK